MSSRPVGPSSRPFHCATFANLPVGRPHHHHHGYAPLLPTMHEPPKLKERGLISRAVCCLSSVGCLLALVGLVASLVRNGTSELGNTISLYGMDHAASTSNHQLYKLEAAATLARGGRSSSKLRQKSVIQRLALLKRAPAGSGVDLAWAQQVFPHWFATKGTSPPSLSGAPTSSSTTSSATTSSAPETPALDPTRALGDLILALSFIAQAELATQQPTAQ